MKKILIYGDSNTWGYIKGGDRLPEESQWPIILGELLGSDYRIAQEGLPGRTAGPLDRVNIYLDGQLPFEAILRSSLPLDVVIVALGTNDFKPSYTQTAKDITANLLWYRSLSNQIAENARFLFILPANFAYKDGGMKGELRQELIDEMKHALKDDGYISLDDIDLSADGVHFSPKGHVQVADLVFSHLTKQG